MRSTGLFILFCFFLSFAPGRTFAQVTARDQVIDTVRCSSDRRQSYALFVPAQYDSKESWPVILIFDPSARGRAGVNAYLEAGRKHAFILACSNNSRNGPLNDNLMAAAAMTRDITERFNIDEKRMYASGFSGGSRFAMTFATSERRIAGVIGCGAGLPGNSLPPVSTGFLYYGMAGNRDMNYPEMYALSDFLSNQPGIVSYFRTFAGEHQWPTPSLMTAAVDWLILQETNKHTIPADPVFISAMEKKTEELVNSTRSAGNLIDAIRYMKAAARDFKGTPFGAGMEKMKTDTEKSPDYRAALRKWNKILSTEQASKEKYINYLGDILNSATVPDSASVWWRREVGTLVRLRDKGTPENCQMASRLLNFISIACSEQATSLYRNGYFTQASFLFEICTLSDNSNPVNYYNLARSQVKAGKTKKAIDALSAAVDKGLILKRKIESDPVFIPLRNDARYKEVIGRMK